MGLDPLAAGASANIAAIIEAEMAALAADADTLRSMLTDGAIVQARVLPSNGLTDLVEIGGLRVAAALPPDLLPGDVIAVRVTGFDGERINVQILPEGTAAQPLPAAPPAAAAPLPSSPASAPPLPAAPHSAPAPAPQVAPPAAVFAAAAVRPPPSPAGAPQPPPAPAADAAARLESIEARLAAARAAVTTGRSVPPNVVRAPMPSTTAFVAPPYVSKAPAPAPSVSGPASPAAPAAAAPAAAPPSAAPPPRGLAAYREPVALLRALRLPITPTNVASARIALETPEKLPSALAALERALPPSTDPRVTTLRTLAAFVARIEPDSPVLATQIAAFVDHVVTGAEPKLAQLLVAQRGIADAPPQPPPAPPAVSSPPAAPSSGVHAPPQAASTPDSAAAQQRSVPPPAPVPEASVVQTARAAERQTALQFDLKTQLLSLAAAPAANAGPHVADAVAGALTAITALQVNAAATLAANPGGFAFALPLALPGGFAQAHVRIDRDAPAAAGVPLDGDNFHIAFVLETKHLGTVAIDLVTVGRTVTLGVKTEALLAANAFGSAIGALRARLERLRYTVAKADSSVAARGASGVIDAGVAAPPPAPAPDGSRVDRSA